jgi:membrane-associated phospholipid phosphatase
LNRFGESIILLLALLITFSALFVKQHIILDIIVGIFWAFSAWILAGYFYRFLANPCMDARTGLKQMTKNLVPIFFVFSTIVLSVAWFR